MLMKMYSVYDSKVEAYLPPLFYKSKGEFLRAFGEACNDSVSEDVPTSDASTCKYPSRKPWMFYVFF